MRPHIQQLVARAAATLNLHEPIVEVGAKRVAAQDKLANLRPFFPGQRFIGCDMDAGVGVDRVENLEAMAFNDGEVGTFVLCDTLEHVRDIEQAFRELARCLDPAKGIVIATSVMLFPVHGYPNDYWRFTPEGFRHLAGVFKWSATFFGGDPNFPHTVALVAAHHTPDSGHLERLIEAVKQLPPAPHYADAKTEAIVRSLGGMLHQQARLHGVEAMSRYGEMGLLSQPGWVLTPGTWIKAALTLPTEGLSLQLRSQGQVLQTVERQNWNALIAEPMTAGPFETTFQFDPQTEFPNQLAQLELWMLFPDNRSSLVARSALGSVLAQADIRRGLQLHAIDDRTQLSRTQPNVPVQAASIASTSTTEKAGRLVHALEARGERIVVDLGCGFRKAGNIGIDATADNTHADLICLLGFDPLPFADGTVDEVVCRDFLEHLPKAVYLESQRKLHYPVMQLIDEVWRVLKPGGLFRSWTPMYPHPEVFQDPTHLSAWTIKSMDYFCGVYAGAKKIYGIRSHFEKLDVREEGFYLFAELRKPV